MTKIPNGFVFYHSQDVETAEEYGFLNLAFGCDTAMYKGFGERGGLSIGKK